MQTASTSGPDSPVKSKKPIPDLQRLQRPPSTTPPSATSVSGLSSTTVNGSLSLAEVKEQLAKKGQYSPPPAQPKSPASRTPPRLIEIGQQPQQPLQRKSAPPAAGGPTGAAVYGALDLSAASPRAADHGGSWTPPPSLAQALVKQRQQLMHAARPPPPSSLSSSSPSPPADSPSSAGSSASPELFLEPTVLAQQQLLQHLQLQSLIQAQHVAQAGLSAGLKKAFEDWSASERIGVKAVAKRK